MTRALCFIAAMLAFASTSVSAPVNSWSNPTSGNWDQASSWSLGVLPDSSQSILLTNAGWKTVAINPSTPVDFPGSMTVSDLTVRGAGNTRNTLLLNNAGTDIPLTVLNGLTLQDDGRILDLNSALVVQGGTVIITNSEIIQDGGLVRLTNAPMDLSGSEYHMINGVFAGGTVWLGAPFTSQFNQYGGTVLITNLLFGPRSPGSPSAYGGTYALYGGNLSLPGGLTLLGENGQMTSYLQQGGTNQTTQVFIEPDLFGTSPSFKLNGGLLADDRVDIFGDDFGSATLEQNGGAHLVSDLVQLTGGAHTIGAPNPATYRLNGGTLSAPAMNLDASSGDAMLIQSNGTAQVGDIQAHSGGIYSYFVTTVNLSGGTLSCSNLSITDGGGIHQYGGALTVNDTLDVTGYREPGPRLYTRYEFFGGTLAASNINIGGDWIIGDSGGTNRISNPGTCSLSHTLQIGDASEQLGRFVLASDATIDLAGSASRLSFANSSGETWAGGATLMISDWNGNPAGGGAEQLIFGADQSGLTSAQLGRIQFRIGSTTNVYAAKILGTGEVVPDNTANVTTPGIASSRQGNNMVLTWPAGWSLRTATNISGPYLDVPGATPPYTNDMAHEQQRFFRLGQ